MRADDLIEESCGNNGCGNNDDREKDQHSESKETGESCANEPIG
jgi:hypothetical protein